MTCLLRHPEVATRSCAECQKWQFDEAGKIQTRGDTPLLRVLPPNCAKCPKESPQNAHRHELSEKNAKAVEFYFTTRAMSGANLTDAMRQDPIVQRNMATIDRIVRPYEAEKAALLAMAPMLTSVTTVPTKKGGGK